MITVDNYSGLEIAVIGMSGRFPQARNIHELWANLKEGKEMITFFSDEELLEQGISEDLINNPAYVKAKGVLSDAECFDAPFFGYTNKEADYMDPQFRVFHECAYHALEDAGYADPKYRGVTGLFAGAGFNPFWIANFLPSFENFSEIFEVSSLNAREYLTTRVAYKLNLDGPTMTLQTACSTSLVAVHMACQSLLAGEADMALAGGVSILFPSMDLPRKYGMLYQQGMIISKDGHCKPFDKDANGFMGGDGVGVVVLKRLEDALEQGDNIYAVIRGSAVNNDGSTKAGYSTPSTKGQVRVIKTALQLANIKAETIGYVETHGSGTRLGDPIEVQALIDAYDCEHGNQCGIGSIKSNLGHLDAAAGIAGFIKTVLTLQHAQIPPSINFNEPNPSIDFENSPFYVNHLLQDWHTHGHPRRAAVSSFGIGGTNAHLVMEEAPKVPTQNPVNKEYLILLSAKTKSALVNSCQKLRAHLEANQDTNIKDLAYTLQVGRRNFDFKRAITCNNVTELIDQLSPEITNKKIVHRKNDESNSMIFVFSGLGGQYVNMGRDLYLKLDDFRDYMNEGFEVVRNLYGFDLKSIVYPTTTDTDEKALSDKIHQFDIAQLTLFILERSLAKLLMSWGIVPVAVIGYSFGEYAAAHIAGVMSLRDTLKLIVKRGELILECQKGAMLSVPLQKGELGVLPDNISLAIDNGESCVLSGPIEDIEQYAKKMQADRRLCLRLPAERAIHSPMIEPVCESLHETLSEIRLSSPAIPMVSNVTGSWVEEEITKPAYWMDHLSKTVEFASSIRTLLALPNNILMEIGPGADITATLQKFIEGDDSHFAINTIRPNASNVADFKYLMIRLQKLWQRGIDIRWETFYKNEQPKRISVPGYAFDKHPYWFKDHEKLEEKAPILARPEQGKLTKNKDHTQWYYIPSWQQCFNSNTSTEFNAISNWLVFSDDTSFSNSLIQELQRQKQAVVILRKGEAFNRTNHSEYTINPLIDGQYEYLFNDLLEDGIVPEKVLHLWSVNRMDFETLEEKELEGVLANSFYSLTNLARAFHEKNLDQQPLEIFAITRNMFSVIGNESLVPIHAPILGACRVLPIEFRNIRCRLIDIEAINESSIEQILYELISQRTDPVVALRNKYLWVQTFEKFTPQLSRSDFRDIISKDKVYVIVGGLCSRSNLGFVLSKHLSDTAPVKIVLLSRTKYPKKGEWKNIASSDNSSGLTNKIKQIVKIEEGQGQVYTYEADITKIKQLSQAIEQIENDVGEISGVINVAGIMDGKAMGLIISNKSHLHFKSQFDIKVQGTINLYKVFKSRKPDFCVLSSSLTSVMGPFAAYCAGNNFMDALVHQLNQGDNKAWLSINWDHLLGFNDKQQDQPLAINHSEIIEVFEHLLPLAKKVPQVVISSAAIEKRIEKTLDIKPNRRETLISGRKPFSKWFYKPGWQKFSFEKNIEVKQENVLVFMQASTFNEVLLKELTDCSSAVVTVENGKNFEDKAGSFTIDSSNPQHYHKLFQTLKDRGVICSSIYHLWNSCDKTSSIEEEEKLADSQIIGFYSLLNITKAMANLPDQAVAINVLTNNMQHVTSQEDLCPEKASMLGVMKVAPVENNKVSYRSFDIDIAEIRKYAQSKLNEVAVSMIACASQVTDRFQMLALRKDNWYAQSLTSIELTTTEARNNVFKNKGTYLFTGGLGGMALNIMKHISKSHLANFIIIDKKALPPKNDWKKSIETLTDDTTTIKQLQNIERAGSRLTIVEGDISDYHAIKDCVADAIAKYGSVNGVFHIAGAIDHAGIIQSRSIEISEKLMAPKLQGTLVLDKLLQDQTLDFIVYFSSTGNIFPKLKFGQVAYNAGHEFLDIYAHAKRRQGENAYVINSNDWHGVGIAAEAAKTHSYRLKNYDISFDELLSIRPREGLYTLTTILENTHPQVVVSAYDVSELQSFINQLDFSEIITNGADEQKGRRGRTRDELSSVYIEPGTHLEKQLAGIFEEIFRIEQVGIDDDFFELGGDSIKAISAISMLQQEHALDLPITTFFEKRTIRNIAEYFGENLAIEPVKEPKQVVEDENFYLPFPMSPIQMAYFMGRSDQFDMGGISTNVYQESKINVDLEVLNRSFNKLLNRHPMLKIVFLADGQQQFHRVDQYEINNTDLRGLDEDAQKEFIEKERKRLSNHLFDEKQWPLFEISTCSLSDGEHYLFFCLDHLICDAASLMILVKEWGMLIKDLEAALPKLAYTYRDYVLDFQQQRESEKFEISKKYWLDRLESFPSAPAIPTKLDASEVQKPKFSRQRKVFSKDEWNKLKALAKNNNCTPSMVLCAAYARVLSFWSNSNDLAINLTLFNRYPFHKDVQQVVGDFTMLVLLGIHLEHDHDFLQDIKNVQKTLLEALDHRFYDGIDFIRDLRKSRQLGTSAAMPYVFTSALFETGFSDEEEHKMLGIWGQQRDAGMAISQTSQVYIDCTTAELNGDLEIVWDHVEELFEKDVIEAMFSQFIAIIENFIKSKNELPLQIPPRHAKIIEQANSKVSVNYPKGKTITSFFEKQVDSTPANIAVTFGNERLSYTELNTRVNQLAHFLRFKGVKREQLVALLLEDSIDKVVGILAVLKAGGCYMPIDPDYPEKRISFILEDSEASAVLISAGIKEQLSQIDLPETEILISDPEVKDYPMDNLPVVNTETDLAYVIYTSGTTGFPKGVMIEHRNVVRLLFHGHSLFDFNSQDVWTMFHAYGFDFSVWEMYGALFFGGKLVLVSRNQARDVNAYAKLLSRHKVTILNQTPSAFTQLVNVIAEKGGDHSSIRKVIFGGERLTPSITKKWLAKYPDTQMINMYGITETTVHVTYKEITEENLQENASNIGVPIPTMSVFILNDHLQPCPIGVVGEMYVGGAGVGRGYLNNETLTIEKFISDTNHTNRRLYKTGDLAKWTNNGELEYIGRKDHQVKIRGFRIELGEIENHLSKINGVNAAVVDIKNDLFNHKYLCAYIVAKGKIYIKEIRKQLSEWLPEYMIPSKFQLIDHIPLTSNGKIDRRLLPEPDKRIDVGIGYEAPKTKMENELINIYSILLNIEKPGINESFFDLGGDSFKATFLISGIQKNLGVKVSLGQIFKTPSARELASSIETNRKSDKETNISIPKIENQDLHPLSGVQKRLFVQQGQGKNTVSLNIFMNQRLQGLLDREKFEQAFKAVIERHEILRTSFESKEGIIYQRVHNHDKWDFTLVYEDLRSEDQLGQLIEDKTNELAYHVFQLLEGELYKVKLLQIEDDEYIILFAIHHILFDLWSQEIFIRDLFHYYHAFLSERAPSLPELNIQYKDYAHWHKQLLSSSVMEQHKQYWLEKLSGNLPVLQLPIDKPRPAKQTFVGDEVYFDLPSDLILGVRQFMAKHDATLFMVLMAALKTLLFKYTGQSDIIVGTPIADREHPDLKDQIGCYINTIPLRDTLSKNSTFEAIIWQVKRNTLEGYEHQACPFDWMIESLDIIPDPSRSPLFDISLVVSKDYDFDVFQNEAKNKIKITPIRKNLKISKSDLLFQIVDSGNNIVGTIQYNIDLFNHDRVERMARHLLILTTALLETPDLPISQISYLTEEENQIEKQRVDLFSAPIDTDF